MCSKKSQIFVYPFSIRLHVKDPYSRYSLENLFVVSQEVFSRLAKISYNLLIFYTATPQMPLSGKCPKNYHFVFWSFFKNES